MCIRIREGPFVRTEKAEMQSRDVDDTIEISVTRLSPGTNYTLLVYTENSFGRSPAAVSVYAVTHGMKFRHVLILLSTFYTTGTRPTYKVNNYYLQC